jgi:beta-lactamase class A
VKLETNKAVIVILSISILLNIYLSALSIRHSFQPHLDKSNKYSLLSKRIFVENQNDMLINFVALRKELKKYVSENDADLGLYFEYLPSGVSVGVNEKIETKIVSLIKIPVVMGIYKEIERGNLDKDQYLTITEQNIDKRYGNLWERGVGTKITLIDTIRYALIYSDNTASVMLGELLPSSTFDEVMNNLEIISTEEADGQLIISPKSFSSVLKSLYLSSYLEKEHSQEILQILTETIFNDKISKGIPEDIEVAHKVGIYNSIDTKEEKVFTDCGIIYIPLRPYLLCMVSKSDEATANKHMQEITKIIFQYVKDLKRI